MMNAYTEKVKERIAGFEDDFSPVIRGLTDIEIRLEHPEISRKMHYSLIFQAALKKYPKIVFDEGLLQGIYYRTIPVHEGVDVDNSWRLIASHPTTFIGSYERMENAPLPDSILQKYRDYRADQRNWTYARDARAWNRKAIDTWGYLTEEGFCQGWGSMGPHELPDFSIPLELGLAGMLEKVEAALPRMTTEGEREQLTCEKICLEAMIGYVLDYAGAIAARAEAVEDDFLGARLRGQAADFRHLAARPPETFRQAAQLVLLCHFFTDVENPGDASSLGRVDAMLWPFYCRDLEAGRLTREEALDIITQFELKLVRPESSCNITVGGRSADGSDETNEVSELFLEALCDTRQLIDLSVRIHAHTTRRFWKLLAETIRLGLGRPNVYNDELEIPGLVDKGFTPAQAANYAVLGCSEIMVPGITTGRTMLGEFHPIAAYDAALNGGRSYSGRTILEGVPDSFHSFEEVILWYHKIEKVVIDAAVELINENEQDNDQYDARPVLTLFSENGLEKGQDLTEDLVSCDSIGFTVYSMTNIVNVLCALKDIVFDRKLITFEQMKQICADNWKGQEALRQYALKQTPCCCDNSALSNEILRRETDFFADCLEGKKSFYGGSYRPMIFGLGHMVQERRHEANISGMLRNEFLPSSLDPDYRKKPLSIIDILGAIAGIDGRRFSGGISNVQMVDRGFTQGEEGSERLIDLLQTYFEQGGLELGLNVQSAEVLIDAQQHPEKYPGLMVRLFGLSARYITLTRQVQDNMIRKALFAEGKQGYAAADI